MSFYKDELNMPLEVEELERKQPHSEAGAAMAGADVSSPPRNRGANVGEAGELATEGISEAAQGMLCEAGAEDAAVEAICEAAGGEAGGAVVEAVGEVVSGIIGSIFDGL